MKIQLETTPILSTLDGVRVRVWNGVTEDGVQCFAFIACLAFRTDEYQGCLTADLVDRDAPGNVDELRGML